MLITFSFLSRMNGFIMSPNDTKPSLLHNEIIISSENEKQFYGDILTLRKMFCIDHSKNLNIYS